MKKIFLLSRMLSKGSGDDVKSAQNADVFNLFMLVILVLCTFTAGLFLAPLFQNFTPNPTLATLFAVLGALLSLVRVFPMIINGLFMSKDVEVLLTLPYSPLQLALSNCINIIRTIFLYQVAASFPFTIGCLIGEANDILNMFIMDFLFVIFVPFFVAFTLILLSTLIMKALKTMANKEFQKIIGVIFAAIGIIALYVICFAPRSSSSALEIDAVASLINSISSFAYIIPVAPLIQDLVCQGAIINLLLIIIIDGVVTCLAFLVLNKFYLQILKQVTNTFGFAKAVTNESIKDSVKNNGVLSALVKKDLKLIFRDSSYYLNGIIVPIILTVFFAVTFYAFMKSVVSGVGVEITWLCGISSGIGLAFVVTAGSASFSGIASCSISREGQSYFFMKQICVPYKTQIKAKRIVALIVSLPLALLVAILCSIIGIFEGVFCWTTLVTSIALLIPTVMFFCNEAIRIDLKKPMFFNTNLNKVTQPKTSLSLVGFLLYIFAFIISLPLHLQPMKFLIGENIFDIVVYITYAAIVLVVVLFIILAWYTTKNLYKKCVIYINNY